MKRGEKFTQHTADTVKAVAALLARHEGPENAATWDQLARESGLGRSQLRKVATERDGLDYLLGVVFPEDGSPHGVFVCVSPEQGEGMTRDLIARATTEMQRAKRRADFAVSMALWPPVQQISFLGRIAS